MGNGFYDGHYEIIGNVAPPRFMAPRESFAVTGDDWIDIVNASHDGGFRASTPRKLCPHVSHPTAKHKVVVHDLTAEGVAQSELFCAALDKSPLRDDPRVRDILRFRGCSIYAHWYPRDRIRQ